MRSGTPVNERVQGASSVLHWMSTCVRQPSHRSSASVQRVVLGHSTADRYENNVAPAVERATTQYVLSKHRNIFAFHCSRHRQNDSDRRLSIFYCYQTFHLRRKSAPDMSYCLLLALLSLKF